LGLAVELTVKVTELHVEVVSRSIVPGRRAVVSSTGTLVKFCWELPQIQLPLIE
jgi:hypothetical protein